MNNFSCRISNFEGYANRGNYDIISMLDDPELMEEMRKEKRMEELRREYMPKMKYRSTQIYLYYKRKPVTGQTEEEVLEKLYKRIYAPSYTMADLLDKWLLWEKENRPVSPKTLQIHRQKWNKYISRYDIATSPIERLTEKDFRNLFRKWTSKREMTRKEFNNTRTVLNGIFNYAIEELEIIQINPVRNVDTSKLPFKPQRKKAKGFIQNDRETMINYLENLEPKKGVDKVYSLAILFFFRETMRIGELMGLKWEDYDRQANNIHICRQRVRGEHGFETVDWTKGHTRDGDRYIPVPEKSRMILEEMKKLNPDGEYIFMYDGHFIYTQTFNDHLQKYCEELGIDRKSSHDIRFASASLLESGGMSLPEIQGLLGHSNLSTTLHYLRQTAPEEVTAQKMNDILS